MKQALKSFALASILWVVVLHAQTPTITGVTNESGSKSLCPGGIAFVAGSNLGGAATKVTVGNLQAFVFNANNGSSLQLELPVNAPLGATTLTAGASAPFSITLVQYCPGIATDGLADSLAGAYHYPSQAAVTTSFPAAPNEQIAVTATGLGATSPVYLTGTSPSGTNALAITTPTVTVQGKPAPVSTAFLQPNNPGYYAVVFTVPASATTGNQNIIVSIGGLASNTAILPVATGPIIGSVTNAASYNDPSLPNGAVAQGAIAVLKGNNLGPTAISIASNPFQSANWSGTSVSITVGGTTVAALMYYTSATQVALLVPSNTPVGTGTITATYNSQTGPAAPITVVANNLGIFTVTSDGGGAGIVTYPDYSLVSSSKAANCGGPYTTCGAANPGDTLILWATGLGPVNGSDAAGAGLGVNMTNIPLKLWLGGVQENVTYQGRSGCCIGEDQITFTVSTSTPTGCAVPLVVQIGNEISNGVAIAVANGSRTCTPTNASLSPLTALLGTTPTVKYGQVDLDRQDNYPGFQDVVQGQFALAAVTAADQPFFLTYIDDSALGTCQVFNNANNGFNVPVSFPNSLDPGSPLTVKGPSGSVVVPGGQGQYSGVLSANGNFLGPGTFTVSFPGGADIPAFSTSITIPALATMTSPPPDSVNSFVVTRANGMIVTWTGGSSSAGYIKLSGSSATNNTYNTGAGFQCVVPASAGTFTIPPSVLLAMPPGNFGGFDFHPTVTPVALITSGLGLAFLDAQYDYFTPLTFK